MAKSITPFLMFEGDAEAAMNFYISLLPASRIDSITRYGDDGPGKPGSVVHATFTLKGQQLACIDSIVKHKFSFTPAISLFVECDSEAEVDMLFEKLSAGGQILMPLGSYPFGKRFGWLNDKFGVSWQVRAN
jgi:predicted 3-demethylubiquinone-9 3-methyltransferase (glyoxalase superfamily)